MRFESLTFGFFPRWSKAHCCINKLLIHRPFAVDATEDSARRKESLWAQIGHNRPKQKGPASLQALDLMVAGEGFEPSTFGL
jgi:hypothetical protein